MQFNPTELMLDRQVKEERLDRQDRREHLGRWDMWLTRLGLQDFELKLQDMGVTKLYDLKHIEENDLIEMGMSEEQQQKFLTETKALPPDQRVIRAAEIYRQWLSPKCGGDSKYGRSSLLWKYFCVCNKVPDLSAISLLNRYTYFIYDK